MKQTQGRLLSSCLVIPATLEYNNQDHVFLNHCDFHAHCDLKTSEDRRSIECLQSSILIYENMCGDRDCDDYDDLVHDVNDVDENLANDMADLPHGKHSLPPRAGRESHHQRLS